MIDASGREVRSATWDLDAGFNLIDWPVNDLMGGVYLLKYDVNGELHTERVVVAR